LQYAEHHTNHTTISKPEEYTFHSREQSKIPLHHLKVNNTDIQILIDSSLNLLDFQTYELVDPRPTLIPSSIKIFGYNADKPLPICGTFLATASADGNQTETTFYVIPGISGSLLSKSTSEELTFSE